MADRPQCFGRPEYWSGSAVECQGGLDPAYTNPRTGSHRRDKCLWFTECATGAVAARMGRPMAQPQAQPSQQTSMIVPVQPIPVQAPPKAPQSHPMVVQNRQFGGWPLQQQPQQPQAMAPPYVAQYGPQAVPVPYSQPGTQLPTFLTVPEPVNLDEPWYGRLFREVGRAMLKSLGWTTASFFDNNPWRPHQPPE